LLSVAKRPKIGPSTAMFLASGSSCCNLFRRSLPSQVITRIE
jgi:hypothetical protein